MKKMPPEACLRVNLKEVFLFTEVPLGLYLCQVVKKLVGTAPYSKLDAPFRVHNTTVVVMVI